MEPNKCNGYCFFDYNELKDIKIVVPQDIISKLETYDKTKNT